MVHVGIDLDKRSSQIAVLTEDGEFVQQRLTNEAGGLEKFFAQLPAQTPIAIEASGTWWWLVDLLEQLGHRPVLSHQADEGHRRRSPQERPRRRRAAGAPAPGRPAAHRLDSAGGAAGGARTRSAPHPTRLAARRGAQSPAGHARPAEPAADVREKLAHAARPAGAERAAVAGRAESDPGGLCGFA